MLGKQTNWSAAARNGRLRKANAATATHRLFPNASGAATPSPVSVQCVRESSATVGHRDGTECSSITKHGAGRGCSRLCVKKASRSAIY